MWFLIKINLVFFSVISQLLESIYTVLIFHHKHQGCAKKVHVSGPIREGGDCYCCDVISNLHLPSGSQSRNLACDYLLS